MIKLHETAKISPLADIEDSQKGSLLSIGEASTVDAFVKMKPAGGSGDLVVGANCYINSGCVFYTGNGIQIGDKVLIAANCTFAPVNHAYKNKNIVILEQGFLPSKGGIIIEDDVWIGAGCVILDGSHIKKGCVVGALSVVRGPLDAYGVYAGQPLVKVSERADHA